MAREEIPARKRELPAKLRAAQLDIYLQLSYLRSNLALSATDLPDALRQPEGSRLMIRADRLPAVR